MVYNQSVQSFASMRHFYGVQSERSVVCNISPVVSVSRRNVFNNYLFNNPDKTFKKKIL